MTIIVVTMIVILAIAAAALAFAAFTDRGEPVPGLPWLGDALRRAADAVPTVKEDEEDADEQLRAAPLP
ncbi:hypothetical protein BH11ACT8_BH11ACT8_31390 [soil metagenome]